ncbi:MAG: hypothetical protein ACI4UN_07415 [Muribaculaceae bacterium]
MDPEILTLISFVVIIVLSAFFKQKKIQQQQQQQQAQPHRQAPPPIDAPWSKVPDFLPHSPGVPRVPKVPKHKAPIQAPEKEGVHAVAVPQQPTEDAYAEPHPDVPRNEDWRRAVIAHEILKTKF